MCVSTYIFMHIYHNFLWRDAMVYLELIRLCFPAVDAQMGGSDAGRQGGWVYISIYICVWIYIHMYMRINHYIYLCIYTCIYTYKL